MKTLSWSLALALGLCVLSVPCGAQETQAVKEPKCRNVPGSAGYPTPAVWDAFNATVSGNLVNVVPSAKYCAELPCTNVQRFSGVFRSTIPGAMDQYNFEQGYDLSPPSLCLRNATTCGQGDVPIYSVEAETVADIQAAVEFASKHNLRVAIKSSGHDTLGRSTAPQSLLIRTTNFKTLAFTDAFFVGTQNMGSAVTLGSGVHAQTLYQQGKANGKAVVGGTAASVCIAGGYVQGAGHSALSPALGLAADNALALSRTSGKLLKVNSISHSDLYYALRGGGAGSWGVVVSVTFKTFPTFNATSGTIILGASNNTATSTVASIHAEHIFDLDSVRASHAFFISKDSAAASSILMLSGIFPKTSTSQSMALLKPFLDAALSVPGVSLISQDYVDRDINDALFQEDDDAGGSGVLGSRLIPVELYRQSPGKVGPVYNELLDSGTTLLIENIVAGGRVAENANISSAVHPAWRTAKNHVIIANLWQDSASLKELNAVREKFKTQQLPILEKISGPNAGSYSNEADGLEKNFMTTFFGPNYAKLSAIKRKYDPKDLLFERWDQLGICKV
ncbi:FAD-binding domain-containing protein [Mycena rebaudengoi]|nr:FAD-binding domain-containing protein [Mycena rebaudengoi]